MHLIQSQQLTMTSREIAELVGKQHRHVLRDIRALKDSLGDLFGGYVQEWTHPQNGQNYEEFVVERDTCMTLMLGYDAVARLKVVIRWQELEAQQAPKLPSNYREALVALIEAEDAKQALAIERDHAIATKAEIGSRREATAMNTASVAVRKANSLERQLDKAKDYCTVKRMSMIHHGQPFDWRALKSASAEMGIAPIDVFDQNYGTVKAYHAAVWLEVYGLEISQ